MKKRHLFLAALFLAALAFGFVGCENPGDLLNNGDDSSITDNDSTTNNPNQGDNSSNGDESERPIPDISSTLVATGAATDVEYSSVTLWGRLNTDSLPMIGNVTGWGIEYAYNRESVESHKHSETTKVKCTTELQGENADEFSVRCYGLNGDTTIYYSAYAMVDMKYIYGEVHSVRLLSRLALSPNEYGWGMVSGSGDYPLGSEVTITATPEENYYFTSWSDGNTDNPRTVVVTSDTTFTANFAKRLYLTVEANNDSYGTVTGSGYYIPGSEVTITAIPNNGASFVKWNDGNTDNPRTVVVTSDTTFIAMFLLPAQSDFDLTWNDIDPLYTGYLHVPSYNLYRYILAIVDPETGWELDLDFLGNATDTEGKLPTGTFTMLTSSTTEYGISPGYIDDDGYVNGSYAVNWDNYSTTFNPFVDGSFTITEADGNTTLEGSFTTESGDEVVVNVTGATPTIRLCNPSGVPAKKTL